MTVLQYLSDCDIKTLNWINHHRFIYSSALFEIISLTTSFVSVGLMLITLFIAIKEKSRLFRKRFFVLLIAFILAASISLLLKNTSHRARPFVTYPFIEKLSEGGNSSFPSGHTLEAFAMATTFASVFSKRALSLILFVWAFTVAYSRMALGVHYPSDVLAGMAIGSFVGVFTGRISKKYFVADEKAGYGV